MFTFHPRWLLLLKIEISSNGQNCFILSQNVPKFELYKAIAHTGELKMEQKQQISKNFHTIGSLFCWSAS
jgi:hypothetical protein